MFNPHLTNKFYSKLKKTTVEALLDSNYIRIPCTGEADINNYVRNLFLCKTCDGVSWSFKGRL